MRFLLSFLSFFIALSVHAETLTSDLLYKSLNMRTFRSSMGQQLKFYCQSYPKDYFSIVHQTKDSLELKRGTQYWDIKIVNHNTIVLSEVIANGTYRSVSEHILFYDEKNKDWRAKDEFIELPSECAVLKKEDDPE